MIAYRTVLYLLGILLSVIAGAMMIPMVVELFIFQTNGWEDFVFGAFITGAIGSLMAIANRSDEKVELKVREVFLLTSLSWVLTPLFAALPIFWSDLDISFMDSWFEAVSALTTTGTTVIPDLEHCPKGVLLWRSLLQWLGGTGIILMALIILPTLRIGGMQLFRSEFSDKSEKILPRASQISSAIATIYFLFTITCASLFYLAGMDLFDAICHSMATVSTGGLSTYTASIAHFQSLPIELITMFFMILGGITFVLYIRIWQGHWRAIFQDSQVRVFLTMILAFTFVMIWWNWRCGMALGQSIRDSAFTVVSISTSTGFTSGNYIQWGSFPLILILVLSTIGACTGSTSGGIKIFRVQILASVALSHLRQLRRPHGVYVPTYQGQRIPETVATSVLTFITLYFFSLICFTVLLTLFDLSVLDSLSAAIAAMSNTGPGITDLVGPSDAIASFPQGAKLLLMLGMIMGRLELLTVFVLFMPSFWKN